MNVIILFSLSAMISFGHKKSRFEGCRVGLFSRQSVTYTIGWSHNRQLGQSGKCAISQAL